MTHVPASPSPVNQSATCHHADFEGEELNFYLFRGRVCLIAAEYGRAMGYADDGGALVHQIRDEWSNEFIRGHHFDVLEGEALREFKAFAARAGKNPVRGNVNHLTVIYEAGADLAGLLTRQPLGKRLRRLVVEEIFPRLRRGEPILPAQTDSSTSENPLVLRERRLADREQRLAAHQKATALRDWAQVVKENELAGDDVILAYLNEAASIEVGRPLLESRPTLQSRLYTATELGAPYGLSSKAIGAIAREIGIFENSEYGEFKMSKGVNNNGVYSHWTYNEKARMEIAAEIVARQQKTA